MTFCCTSEIQKSHDLIQGKGRLDNGFAVVVVISNRQRRKEVIQ